MQVFIMFLGGSAYRNRMGDLTSEGSFSSFVVPKGMLLKLRADKSDFLPFSLLGILELSNVYNPDFLNTIKRSQLLKKIHIHANVRIRPTHFKSNA